MVTLSFTTRLVLIGLISVCNAFFCAHAASQTPPPQSDSISVTLGMEKEQVAKGQSAWVTLTVRNLSDHEVPLHDWMYRLHVEGQKGEPPTTQVQRQSTGRLRPGEAPLRADEYVVPIISPGKSYTHRFLLAYFYDLSVPGRYTAYLEVMDPSTQKLSTQKWVRTNTVQFTMQASNH
jgi:hypothetical protein